MTWTLVSEGLFKCYHCMDQEKIIATLKLNEATGSLRLEYGEKRLFFMHPKKKERNHLIFSNEYGYTVGSFALVDKQAGTVQHGNKIYFFVQERDVVSIYNDRNEIEIRYQVDTSLTVLQSAAMVFAAVWTKQQTVLPEKAPLAAAV